MKLKVVVRGWVGVDGGWGVGNDKAFEQNL